MFKKMYEPKKDVQKAYFENKTSDYFVDKTTTLIKQDYNDFKNNIDPVENDLTSKQMNRLVRKIYPDLEIIRTTRNKEQIFLYRKKEE